MARYLAITLAGLAGLAATPASATLITGVTATSSAGTWPSYDIADLTNGDGLSSISPDATHSNAYSTQWLTDGSVTGELIFDLGGSYDVGGAYIWPYSYEASEDRSIRTFSLDLSADGSVYTTVLDSVTLPQFQNTATFFDLSGAGFFASFARLRFSENYGNPAYSGLAEVQFLDGPLVATPLPAALPLFAGALALGGLVLRRARA